MNKQLNRAKEISKLIKDADYILIGAGSGLSTAAGLEYAGERFTKNFSDFIEKYHFTDMYTASFYEFETEEEKWAYWAKHIYLNDTGVSGTKLYKNILYLIKEKKYFVITTNVDDQFAKSGFNIDEIFATQGSYKYIQCSEACHNTLYDDTEIVEKMLKETVNLKIPTELVPRCPVCGGKMEVNLRKDAYFVQDGKWYKQDKKYGNFLDKIKGKRVILLELGVGFNTPGIIRIPFEKMIYENNNWKLIRINKDNCMTFFDIEDKSILIEDDINKVIDEVLNLM